MRFSSNRHRDSIEQELSHEPPLAHIPTVLAPKLSKLAENIGIAAFLFSTYGTAPMKLEHVIDVLNDAGVKYFLAGAHASGIWANMPRATIDVDVLVASRDVRKAIAAVQASFPRLQLRDTPIVARFIDLRLGQIVLDIMKPNQPLFQFAMRNVQRVMRRGREFPIPNLEFMLAMKFAAMVGPYRREAKKFYDVGDFINIVRANPKIDLRRLSKFGERVYSGGGAELLELVDKARRGERISV